MNELYNAKVDKVTSDMNSICKDNGMLDKFAYIMITRMVDRFGITPEEAMEFMTSTANEAFKFALDGETED